MLAFWFRDSSVVKVFFFFNPANELISVASLLILLPKDLPLLINDNRSLVSEKSRNFFCPDAWQP